MSFRGAQCSLLHLYTIVEIYDTQISQPLRNPDMEEHSTYQMMEKTLRIFEYKQTESRNEPMDSIPMDFTEKTLHDSIDTEILTRAL